MRSLAWKLGAALVMVAVIAIGIMAVITNLNTSRQFQSYIETSPAFIETVSRTLAVFYAQNRSWAGVENLLPQLVANTSDRLVVADSSGQIVGDTAGELSGVNLSQTDLTGGYTIRTMMGFQGGMGGGGQIVGQAFYVGQTGVAAEQAFLNQTNRWLWLSGGIAVILAVVLAVILARNFIRPLRALDTGAREIASGNLGYRVKIDSGDEAGRLAESFNAMAGSLQQSEEARKRLLADVAHELRTPLTIISGTVDAISDGVLPADEKQLKIIKSESQVLTRLIADLRDLSLAEAGELKLELSSVDLADLVRRKAEQFKPLAEAKGISLISEAAEALPSVPGDWVRLEQVFANLFSNAIRHTPAGGRITVSFNPDTLEGTPAVTAAVTDTGEGMTIEQLEHIFDRFYRVEDSRARAEGNGAGLGLAIVKQMVAAHHGRVRVESRPGRGSTFHITLPAAG
ncbi:sensor histidine kinase [Dehalogenimonas alkenigignens]|uniref:histidine kinase n=1 Tax=Dehalogenimonas alkenigignens TaxID=1217799 RepID=A0A0W0GI23_9CHLR|nr:ATP-binding protein [Dehalogenimonas alkenigignens]KTB48201.1 Signal transduction histidine kinase [Dehalogenimonas alkenigignens]PVV84440.1 sensor histidine kinase [Dehalogenimonas alkenigignens]